MKALAATMFLCLAIAVIIAASMPEVKASQPTKQWRIGEVQSPHITVDVIDTGSVCIYLMDGYESGGIAVLPKSQLSSGKGCQ